MKTVFLVVCNLYLAQGFVPFGSKATLKPTYGKVSDALDEFGNNYDRNSKETLGMLEEINEDFKRLVQLKRQSLQVVGTSDRTEAMAKDAPMNRTPMSYFDSLYGKNASKRRDTVLFAQPEKEMRQELAERTSIIKDEEQYAIRDGPGVLPLQEEEEEVVTSEEDIPEGENEAERLKRRMERLTKRRAYPLFLAEKGIELIEGILPGQSAFVYKGTEREKIVVLGTGWGAVSFLKGIDTSLYDVTVISPRNYFLFTPMLAGASVGTVEYRSITEPVREINRKVNYLEATATEIDPKTKVVTCESVVCDGNSCDIEDFTVEYDRLVVTVGAQTNTFGIPGVREYCCFLKQVEDARRIRTAIVNCFERANLPSLTDEQRENDLTIAVIGAGPTGIEFAAELRDFVEEDGPKYYPNLLKHVRIKVIEAASSVLAPFDKALQEEAIRVMNRSVEISDSDVRSLLPERFQLVELKLDQSVKEVTDKSIMLNSGEEIPYGLAVWAAGNGPLPITLQLVEALGEEQAEEQDVARGRVAIDPWMRAAGGNGDILAFGDCTCITRGQLPATAQVAAQQGEYLANMLNKQYDLKPSKVDGVVPPPMKTGETKSSLSDTVANLATLSNGEYAKPFQFLDLGILAYTGGGSALAQVTPAPDAPPLKGTGKIGNTVWRSVYLSKQVSWRNRLLVLNDWTKRQLFGRDITRV
ncbi:Internal alternative NAD(P)H-ubiquinone oxidoreductase A1, mitochondrial [Seminavis robusta]|uniref:NADH:ubiquinone reductase (non-electrogenic) n=1 Tax=Seminavis robusta TaxID=568900 RepID=A0A9N8EUR4_9STRA|nr:Internal alternative NAD(P)H-ubiquinone oxidoreductase A1, mitochondrial [Seminavis robusta]|eukprot:Sro1741_g294680.1 Internal alternative NAD(P)H-ubiquinone oxidoreductase A1, mitochondrial (698) ;mRNA; r:17840-20141